MKKFLLAALCLPLLQAARGQAAGTASAGSAPVLKEGKVIYEQKINVRRRITDESMKAMLPEFSTSKKELYFSGDESVYKIVAEVEDIRDKAGDGNNGMVIKFNNG